MNRSRRADRPFEQERRPPARLCAGGLRLVLERGSFRLGQDHTDLAAFNGRFVIVAGEDVVSAIYTGEAGIVIAVVADLIDSHLLGYRVFLVGGGDGGGHHVRKTGSGGGIRSSL